MNRAVNKYSSLFVAAQSPFVLHPAEYISREKYGKQKVNTIGNVLILISMAGVAYTDLQ